MSITRKAFCERLLSGSIVLLFNGCGGGGSGYSSAPAPAPTPTAAGTSCGASGAAIAGNHGHALTVPATDLDSTVAVTYNIQAAADHNHTVTLSAGQLAQLKAGQTVTVTSSTTEAHEHAVTVSCA